MPAIAAGDGPVAVTGCSGFIGGHIVRELVVHGYSVRACMRDASSWRGQDCAQYLERLPNVEIVDGCDLFTPGSYDAALRGCVGVFHSAAVLGNSADGKSQPLGSGDVPRDVYDGGMIGTSNVANAVNASGSVRRVVYTSSTSAVIGAKAATRPKGYEWTETDWSSDEVAEEDWQSPRNSYARSKVDTERFLNRAAAASNGRWDVVAMNPGQVCGPILFKAQVGQWVEQIGRLAGGLEPNWPTRYDMNYNFVDVRDLASAHRLAAESTTDHKATRGGSRYILHGSGGRSVLRFSTEVVGIIRANFPSFVVGEPATVNDAGEPIAVQSNTLNDCKKAKSVLGVTMRPAQDTIRDLVESFVELGAITPRLRSAQTTCRRHSAGLEQ